MNITEKRKRRKKPYSSISYTTGDIGLNIDRFNTAMGTADSGDFVDGAGVTGASEGAGLGEGLITEAKRYVRRYYIRPQNIFCSNKAEILKALIELGNQNCSVYTLNNLGDDKDVSKLMNNDIIYYYDDGILYDKNRVKVMDYDLSIKKEEDRKKLAKVNSDSKEFKSEYEDRMTTATELEENMSSLAPIFANCDYEVIEADYTAQGEIIVSLNHNVPDVEDTANELIGCLERHNMHIVDWNTNGSNVFIFELSPDNELDLDFDDINAYGESLTEAAHTNCCICGEDIGGKGKNPEPYMSADSGLCCASCHLHFVAPMTQAEEED